MMSRMVDEAPNSSRKIFFGAGTLIADWIILLPLSPRLSKDKG
jgi:hypothetical protein